MSSKPLENNVLLPEHITKACGEALACYCRERGIRDEAAIRALAPLVEDTAQRIHLALVREQQK